MNRQQLQHVIRAASVICQERDFIVIGSQAIHGSLIDADEVELVRSMEADLYPADAPEKSQELNAIGELSVFHNQYGYYADGVDETTATLPTGWRDRLVLISGPLTENVNGVSGTRLVPGNARPCDFKARRGTRKGSRFLPGASPYRQTFSDDAPRKAC